MISVVKELIAVCILASISITVTAVTQSQATSARLSHSYQLGNYGQYSMQYKSVEATTEVRIASCLK